MSPTSVAEPAEPDLLQVFIELRAGDPAAVSALSIVRTRLAAGHELLRLRRVRVFEVRGALPGRTELTELLHRSTRFYNPAKERCTLRTAPSEPAPFAADEALLLVLDRGLERRAAVERWWRHEQLAKVEVREGTVWALGFAPGVNVERQASSLAAVTTRAEGLFCNPHFQDWRPGDGARPPWPWLARTRRARKGDMR
jgi:hypothetical protein